MKRFVIGSSYFYRWIGDSDLVITCKVVNRTAATITIQEPGQPPRRLKINAGLSNCRGAESVYPTGRYSLAPILSADHPIIDIA